MNTSRGLLPTIRPAKRQASRKPIPFTPHLRHSFIDGEIKSDVPVTLGGPNMNGPWSSRSSIELWGYIWPLSLVSWNQKSEACFSLVLGWFWRGIVAMTIPMLQKRIPIDHREDSNQASGHQNARNENPSNRSPSNFVSWKNLILWANTKTTPYL